MIKFELSKIKTQSFITLCNVWPVAGTPCNYNTHNFTLLDEPARYTYALDPKYMNWLLPADRTTTGNIEEQNIKYEQLVRKF